MYQPWSRLDQKLSGLHIDNAPYRNSKLFHMAERVSGDQISWRQSSQPPIYPWDQWFDGTIWRLTPGEDFDGPVASFRTYCYRQAGERDYRLRTRLSHDGLYIQALALDGSELGQLDERGLPISPQSP